MLNKQLRDSLWSKTMDDPGIDEINGEKTILDGRTWLNVEKWIEPREKEKNVLNVRGTKSERKNRATYFSLIAKRHSSLLLTPVI